MTKVSWPRGGLVLALITLAGFTLRLPLLMRFPLREDEAIYGYWALHAWYVDPLFLQVWPDKPPVFLWLLSAAFQLWGHGPDTAAAAARLVNIMAGTLMIPVLAACARRWWGQGAAVVAAFVLALNPFAISFAPTAYTDPLLVLAASLALALVVRRRWFWSGFWLGIAVMAKQQGLLFAPLIVVCARCPPNRARFRDLLRFLAGLATVVLPILYWDSLRWATAPSPWDLGATNVGGVTLLPVSSWIERSAGWTALIWFLLASPWAWAIYTFGLVAATLVAWRRRAPLASWVPALVVAAWAGGFFLLHLGTSIQAWDRYLLPLVIPLALLGGWATAELAHVLPVMGHRAQALPAGTLADRTPNAYQNWVVAMSLAGTLMVLAGPAALAAQGGIPIGGDHGAYAGLDEALAAVDTPHALLFHRELGWHARFSLFDSLRNGDVTLRYFPSAVYLADSATKSPHKQRFVIVPDWAPLPDLPLQLAVRGLQAQLYQRSGHFAVYRIMELPAADASWRVCQMPLFQTSLVR